MKKVTIALTLMALSSSAIAHEGHGVDVNSLFHYLASPHLLVTALISVSVISVGYFAIRRFNQR